MNSRNPKFWALIGFGVGAVLAAAGTMSSPFESLVGGLIQAAIWYGISTIIINKRNKVSSITTKTFSSNSSMDDSKTESLRVESVKTCDDCKSAVSMSVFNCKKCGGTTFTHDKVVSGFNQESSEEALDRIFKSSQVQTKFENPEYKNCPMCAEQIRFAAKKCRFCQHMLQI